MDRIAVEMEFIFKASPSILYKFLTTPSCLTRWFSDTVNINRDLYVFTWEGYQEEAVLLEDEEDTLLKFRWVETEYEDEFFQFEISRSSVTGETILTITDFADEDEIDEQRNYWDKNVEKLKQACGG